MENEAQIKEFIENKQKDSVSWTFEAIKTEFDSLIWKEEKETGDWLHLFEWLKNDTALLKYAELKAKEWELKWWDKLKIELLELRLSVTCPYFKDFKTFLEELNKWENMPQTWETWNESAEFQGKTFCGFSINNIKSNPYYKNSQTWVTWCSKTARENWKKFWIVLPSWNAYDAWKEPGDDCIVTIPSNKIHDKPTKRWWWIPEWEFLSDSKWNFADIYVESQSDYGHRASAFKDDSGQRYVLDPYTRVNWNMDTAPKKLEDYIKVKEILKAHFYESKWYVPDSQEVAENPQVEKAVQRAISIAEDNCHGYERWSKWQNWQYDCSWLVNAAFKQAWFDIQNKSWTKSMKEEYEDLWFEWITPYDPNNLKRGDIVLKNEWADGERHTEIYTWNWKFVWARSNYDNKSGDSSWNEIAESSASWLTNFWWNWVLRYKW